MLPRRMHSDLFGYGHVLRTCTPPEALPPDDGEAMPCSHQPGVQTSQGSRSVCYALQTPPLSVLVQVHKHSFLDSIKEDANHVIHLPDKFVEFYLLAANFMEEFEVPPDFDFGVYTREMISQAVADTINISRANWSILSLGSALTWAITASVNGMGTISVRVVEPTCRPRRSRLKPRRSS